MVPKARFLVLEKSSGQKISTKAFFFPYFVLISQDFGNKIFALKRLLYTIQ